MSLDIVRGAIKNNPASEKVIECIRKFKNKFTGTLYMAYPLSVDKEGNIITVDAMLITKEKGIVALVFESAQGLQNCIDEQEQMYYHITNTLHGYESLRDRRTLAILPNVITVGEREENETVKDNGFIYSTPNHLEKTIQELPDFDSAYYEKLNEALQKISSMKPKKKRVNVRGNKTYGSIMKEIEKQTANLDMWQKKAAFEIPDGPQRIRGLAGSGKTVVLALKAAYLHSQWPQWHIAVTFYTRSLAQQFVEMITNFSREYTGEEPDWSHLHILHAWGTYTEEGVYSTACKYLGIDAINYSNAVSKYGKSAFEGICNELVELCEDREYPIYDVILIDEAQDMPVPFFRLCYKLVKMPKRLVFAYDELQNLAGSTMPSLSEMFGVENDGSSKVTLINRDNEARQDVVLPVCYRNTPWTLTVAHALGFGIYRKEGLVQLFSDYNLWEDIGYTVISGELQSGKQVSLKRRSDTTPSYFENLLLPEDSVKINEFATREIQYKEVAKEISDNIRNNELDPDDILVVFPEPYYAKSDYSEFKKYLRIYGINSYLVGVGTARDVFKIDGSITCAHVYRAKGNEAPMVYVLNSDYCAKNIELRKARNTLFTAITRSRAWVRVYGVGECMNILLEEAKKCISNNFSLSFTIPTEKELEHINLIHRDRTEAEIREMRRASDLFKGINSMIANGVDIKQLPEFQELMNKIKDTRDNE